MSEHQRTLADPPFPGDNGLVDPALEHILDDEVAVLAAFGTARVYVTVVAVLTSDRELVATQGDKNADMAVVLLTGADGRKGLLAFSSVEAMKRWNPDARPVPVYGRDAARAAIAEGAAAILLDITSETFQVIETDDVQHVANEDILVRTEQGSAWVRPPETP